jgi:hypothetical protein
MIFFAERHHRVDGPGAVEPAYAVEILEWMDVAELLEWMDVAELLEWMDVAELLEWMDVAELLDQADAVPMKGSGFLLVRYWVNDELPGRQQLLEKSAFHPECLQ